MVNRPVNLFETDQCRVSVNTLYCSGFRGWILRVSFAYILDIGPTFSPLYPCIGLHDTCIVMHGRAGPTSHIFEPTLKAYNLISCIGLGL